MRRMQFRVAAAVAAWALLATDPTLAEERFDLEWSRADADGIEIYIDTNLPDETPAMLSAVRTYTMMEKGKLTTYSHAYFDEKGPLVNFRLMDRIPTDDAKWARGLKADLDKWARLGMPSEVRSISENIEVRAYVYARENGRNKLIAKSEITVQLPLSDAGRIPRRSASIPVDNLVVNRTYRLLGQGTPLMPWFRPRAGGVTDLDRTLHPLARRRGRWRVALVCRRFVARIRCKGVRSQDRSERRSRTASVVPCVDRGGDARWFVACGPRSRCAMRSEVPGASPWLAWLLRP